MVKQHGKFVDYTAQIIQHDIDHFDKTMQFAKLFLLPVSGVFFVFFLIAAITQIAAFARGLTPYPKWCWVFSMLSGIVIIVIMRFAGNHPLAYAISTAWISIGALWTFGGLLAMSSKISKD